MPVFWNFTVIYLCVICSHLLDSVLKFISNFLELLLAWPLLSPTPWFLSSFLKLCYSDVENLVKDKVIISHSSFLLVYFWILQRLKCSILLFLRLFGNQCSWCDVDPAPHLPLLASTGTEAFHCVATLADTLVFSHWLCEGQEAGCSPPILRLWMVAGTAGFGPIALAVTPRSRQ